MKVTIDANVFFSALIKDGFTRSLMIKSDFTLYAPTFILIEINKYESYLLQKSKLDVQTFNEVKETLLRRITLVSGEALKPYLIPASTLISDEKDWIYLACALKENTIIWSDDPDLKEQNRIVVKTLQELAKEELKK